MSFRRHQNNIQALIDEKGELLYKPDEIENKAINFYNDLFNGILNTNFPTFRSIYNINEEGQQYLTRQINIEEVESTVFYVHDDKSPGPDGLNAKFMKLHWEHTKYDLLSATSDMFVAGKIPKGINHTFISLNPKVDSASNITKYRHISCCNMCYKMLSKVLCNRSLPHKSDSLYRGRCIGKYFIST